MSGFPRKFGRYELVGHLSNGGMAQVYLARVLGQSAASTKVIAIKCVLPSLSDDQSFVKLFEREIGLAMALNHPNIIRIYDFGVVGAEYYLAMEFVFGKNLKDVGQRIADAGSLPPVGLSAYVVAQVCKALAYAHGYVDPVTKKPAGIIHRDISPQNILLGYNGKVKLFDFGVAKIGARETGTEAGVVKGKPAYLAPEQARGEELDDRVDIFALGIVLWEQLTGRRLFFDPQPLMAIKKVVDMEIPPPSSINPAVPPVLDKIVLKALERERHRRYQLCKEFGADLERALFNEGVVYGEKQVRELMGAVFHETMQGELQAMQQKFSDQAAAPPLPASAPGETTAVMRPGAGAPPPPPAALGERTALTHTAISETSGLIRVPVADSTGAIRLAPVAPAQPAPLAPEAPRSSLLVNVAAAAILVLTGVFAANVMRTEAPAPVFAPASPPAPAPPAAAPVAVAPPPPGAQAAHAGSPPQPGAQADVGIVKERRPAEAKAVNPDNAAAPKTEAQESAGKPNENPGEAICDPGVPYTPTCQGSGFIGCLGSDMLSGTGSQNSSGGAIELYCEGGKTRVCLTWERCPWRPGKQNPAHFPLGLAASPASPNDMTCSPLGLAISVGRPSARFANCKAGMSCGFSTLECDIYGQLTVQ